MKICVYGASSDNLDKEYFEAAHSLGKLMALEGHTLVFGGGKGGLMGACARGAYENGGEVIGIAPSFFDEPGVLFENCSRFIFTETMRERKALMEEESEGFIVLPGGIGTFEEFFEMLTLKQLGRHSKPMAVMNVLGYYEAMQQMLKKAVEDGFMSKDCMELYGFCGSAREALDHLRLSPVISGSIKRLSDYNK